MNFVDAGLDAAAWLFRPSVLILARPAEFCVLAVSLFYNALHFVGRYVFLGFFCFYYVVTRVAAHWVFRVDSILFDICGTAFPSPASGPHLPISIKLGDILIAFLPIVLAILLESLQRSSGEKVTWEEREEELKRRWEDQFENQRYRLEMERQEMEEKRKKLEDERKELELDREEMERERVETREMLLREWWSEKQELDEEEAEAENARMAEREKEEKEYQDSERRRREQEKREYLEERDAEREVWIVEEETWRKQEIREYQERRDAGRARWEQLEIKRRLKWCQMRMPWVQTTAEFKKEVQGMDLEIPD
jgi:hypothetical protein